MHVLHYSDIIPRNYCCSEMENAFFLHYHYCLDKSGFTLIDKSAQVALFCFSSIGLCFGCKMSGRCLEAICLIQQTISPLFVQILSKPRDISIRAQEGMYFCCCNPLPSIKA